MMPFPQGDPETDKKIARTQLATVSLMLCLPVVLFTVGAYVAAEQGAFGLGVYLSCLAVVGLVFAVMAINTPLGVAAFVVALIAFALCVYWTAAVYQTADDLNSCLGGLLC